MQVPTNSTKSWNKIENRKKNGCTRTNYMELTTAVIQNQQCARMITFCTQICSVNNPLLTLYDRYAIRGSGVCCYELTTGSKIYEVENESMTEVSNLTQFVVDYENLYTTCDTNVRIYTKSDGKEIASFSVGEQYSGPY